MKKGRFSDKKGLSPVIASVLLIMLVLFLAALIFLWARGFISEQIEKRGQPVDRLCETVDFDFEIIKASGQYELEVRNNGNVDIHSLDIKKFKGGNSEISKFKFSVDAQDAISGKVDLIMEDNTDPESVTIYPVLLGGVVGKSENKVYTCFEQGKTVQVGNI